MQYYVISWQVLVWFYRSLVWCAQCRGCGLASVLCCGLVCCGVPWLGIMCSGMDVAWGSIAYCAVAWRIV